MDTIEKIDPAMSVSCDEMIEIVVASKYSIGNQIGIIRQRDQKPEEFQEFYDFVEQVKKEVKAEYAENAAAKGEEDTADHADDGTAVPDETATGQHGDV